MYIPAHFAADEQAVDDLLVHHGAADLITVTPEGVLATMLPFVYDPAARTLRGHLARNNDQWWQPVLGEALVIARGPDAYVSPAWYPSKSEHGRVVPTWNYVTAHVYGRLKVMTTLRGSNRTCGTSPNVTRRGGPNHGPSMTRRHSSSRVCCGPSSEWSW